MPKEIVGIGAANVDIMGESAARLVMFFFIRSLLAHDTGLSPVASPKGFPPVWRIALWKPSGAPRFRIILTICYYTKRKDE